jgi:hypothetical protein
MAPLGSLVVIQGDLKELTEENYAKLRWRIENKGFDAPIFVWENMILDGTQRYRVLNKMLAEGWQLPEGLVPVCDIEAENLEEAKERLLGYVSQYGQVTEDGLYEFLNGMAEPHLESVDLPDFDMGAFQEGYLNTGVPGTDSNGTEGTGTVGEPVVQYTIIFDNEEQQQHWYDFLRKINLEYDGQTVAARLDAFLETLDDGPSEEVS